jgi:hypothetical protein
MAKQTKMGIAWRPDNPPKKTSIGRGNVKTSSMNKTKRRNYKTYRGQG